MSRAERTGTNYKIQFGSPSLSLVLNRDNYVRILTQNVQGRMIYNFDKMNLYQIDLLKAEYDTCSVMHYNEYAFSKVDYNNLVNYLID